VTLISNEAKPTITIRDNRVETHISWLPAVMVVSFELFCVVALMRFRRRRGARKFGVSPRVDPRQILKVRLASGEIDEATYLSLRRLLDE